MLAIWAPFILFDGVQMVFVYALRSLGRQIAAGVNGIIAFFLVTGGLGWLLIRHWEIGPMGLVYASAAGMVVAALLRSEEHTSELQSLMRISYAVFCLKKKNE